MSKSTSKNVGKAVAAGAVIAALSTAGYLLFGPNGKKNRKTVSTWASKMKEELIEKIGQVKELTEPIYQNIVDQVAEKYAAKGEVSKAELRQLVTEMKDHWRVIASESKTQAKD